MSTSASPASISASTPAPLMLGVSGLRGISGASLTPELAVRYAAAIGTLLMERAGNPAPKWSDRAAAAAEAGEHIKNRVRVVLGYDGRIGGDTWYHAVASGLKSTGCDVIMLGVAMTPTMGVATDHAGADAGVQITASHNPQDWNGVKLLLRQRGLARGKVDACAPPKQLAADLVDRFRDSRFTLRPWDGLGFTIAPGVAASGHAIHRAIVRDLMKDLGVTALIKKRKFTAVLDCVNGSGAMAADFLRDDLGVKVSPLGLTPGRPFWHTPEPIAANLKAVSREVKKARAAVGFCQDPDADRLALIDETGSYIGEEYTLVLAAMALAEFGIIRKNSHLAVNLSTSRMIEDVAASAKATVLRTAVGEANVVEAMKVNSCVLGGEGNGGVIWPKVTYIRDSLCAMGLTLALMARTGKTLSQLVASTPAYAIEKRKVDLAAKEHAQPAIEKLSKAYASERLDTQDGIRIDFDSARAWLHVRASNTEPIMRLIAEAPTKKQSQSILDEAAKIIAG
jgi:phosphomannomutase